MTTTLILTDGVTTVNLIYHSSSNPGYDLMQGWAPKVAPLRRDELSGVGPYADVVEDIQFRIFGTTAADAYAKADTVNRLLDQADRWWWRQEPVSAVKLQYSPTGATVSSSGSPLQVIVLGRVGGDTDMLSLPATFNKGVNGFVIDGLRIRVLRRGQWIGANDNTGASGAAANATVITQNFGASVTTSAPLGIEIGGFNKTTTPIIRAGYVCVGSASTDVQVLEAETGATGAWTSVADAANLARSGNVLRYTPAATTASTCATITLTAIGGSPVAIIAAVRNNSATTSFTLRANLVTSRQGASTPDVVIDTSSTNPRLVLLGTAFGISITGITLTATASAASGTLDIDFLIVVNLRNETCAIVAHDEVSLSTLATAGAATLDFLFNPLTDRAPITYVGGTGGTLPLVYRGALPLQTVGANVYALWTAPNANYWRFTDTANAIVNVTINAGRYRAYLVPQ